MEKLSHRQLIVWQKAMELVIAIYKLTNNFPQTETYGLTSQMRRCAVSIPSNIAEGRKRGSAKEYRHFLLIAAGSCAELETQLELVGRLSLGIHSHREQAESLLVEVGKMLSTMSNTLKFRLAPRT